MPEGKPPARRTKGSGPVHRQVPNLVRPGREQRYGFRAGCRRSAGTLRPPRNTCFRPFYGRPSDLARTDARMAYQVLARKWRPQDFASLVGQETIVTALRNALAEGRIAQAYVFSGIRGVGKTTAARLLAKALNCEQGPTATPCNVCVACREITAGSDID